MTKREKLLLAGVVGVVGLWVLWRGLASYQDNLADRRSDLVAVQGKLDRARIESMESKQALLNLEAWQERSLPADPQVAQTEYRDWLVEHLGEAGLAFSNVRRVGARPVGDAYTALTYMAHAEGTLEQVTRFLHAFYSSRIMHKLTLFKMAPLNTAGKLSLDITVEALIVDGAIRKDGVIEGESGRLAQGSLQDYLASIEGRNLFEPYIPPPPPRPKPKPRVVVERPTPPPPPKFDDSKHAFLTAVIGGGDGPQAWINVRTTGQTLYLRPGEEFEVGQFKGRVKSIDLAKRQIIVETEDELLQVGIGSHLQEASPAG